MHSLLFDWDIFGTIKILGKMNSFRFRNFVVCTDVILFIVPKYRFVFRFV